MTRNQVRAARRRVLTVLADPRMAALSTVAVAAAARVSWATAAKVRAALEGERPAQRLGLDGKKQSATNRRRQAPRREPGPRAAGSKPRPRLPAWAEELRERAEAAGEAGLPARGQDGGRLRAPFPFFGSKRSAAALVWARLGDVPHYVEPFAGSLAVLLARPTPPRLETVNDRDHQIVNWWRAVRRDPEAVAAYADDPAFEVELVARRRWLVLGDDARAFRERVESDSDYFDPKAAGWWAWGQCAWAGGGWCGGPAGADRPRAGVGKLRISADHPGSYGCGVHAKGPTTPGASGSCARRRAWLVDWFGRLRDRLRAVRVCCGDWHRVVGSDSATTKQGLTGVFLDPPYGTSAGRARGLYGVESGTVAADVRRWCLARGADPMLRIVLAGFSGEGHEELEACGWKSVAWQRTKAVATGGRKNAGRERCWFSPHCLPPGDVK